MEDTLTEIDVSGGDVASVVVDLSETNDLLTQIIGQLELTDNRLEHMEQCISVPWYDSILQSRQSVVDGFTALIMVSGFVGGFILAFMFFKGGR